MRTVLGAIFIGLVGAVIYDALPMVALKLARLASMLTPPMLRQEVDPYADTAAAVQAIEAGTETRFSVFRFAAGALFLGVPSLVFLYLTVQLQSALVYRRAKSELKEVWRLGEGREPVEQTYWPPPPNVTGGTSTLHYEENQFSVELDATYAELLAVVNHAIELDGRGMHPAVSAQHAVRLLLDGHSKRRFRRATGLSRRVCRIVFIQSRPYRRALQRY